MAKLSKKTQDEQINKEIERLNNIFKDLAEDKKNVAQRLIERVAFMTVTLQILEDDIKTNGATYMFEQGVQKMKVENPAQKSYNTMINRYTAAYDKLINLLPKDDAPQEHDDGFDSFVVNRE
jgi:cysteinyl-tRNA synthetase